CRAQHKKQSLPLSNFAFGSRRGRKYWKVTGIRISALSRSAAADRGPKHSFSDDKSQRVKPSDHCVSASRNPQRFHGIDDGGAPGREVACEPCGCAQYKRHDAVGDWVERTHAEEEDCH